MFFSLLLSRRTQFVRFLELGLILRWTRFPGFREALNPGVINWSIDAEDFMEKIYDFDGGMIVYKSPVSW